MSHKQLQSTRANASLQTSNSEDVTTSSTDDDQLLKEAETVEKINLLKRNLGMSN